MTKRALVLGSGGITGIAWEWGILAGLAAAGVDLSDADLVVGTSAGSVVGTQVATGLDVQERYEAQLAPPDREIGGTLGKKVLLRYVLAMVGPRSRTPARIGTYAARARTGTSAEDRVAVIGSRLSVTEWPDRPLRITAVDVADGGFRVFDKESGVPLVRAVAASCAVPGVWPPVPVDGRAYMDGGVRSGANADLAAGYERVVVIAPLPRGLGTDVASEVEALRSGSRVALVTPAAAALKSFGRNVLDPDKRADAARAGRTQSAAVVALVRAVWATE